ncbi:MAG: DUF4286 domain-containing protein [Myxococcales bacterium]|nr:DUF4286 domain-containing protein [Myxococcales bacterium]
MTAPPNREIFYEVRCLLADPADRDPYVAWLCNTHVPEVCAAGAGSGAVLVSDEVPLEVRVLYMFSSRDALATYERDEAPRLRAAGVRFLTALGAAERVTFTRLRGERLAVACGA